LCTLGSSSDFRLNGACADLGSECPVRVHSDSSRMPLVLGNPHNPQRLTAILPKPGTNSSHPRYTQFPTRVHRMSNPGTQNVRFRYKGELHIRKQVLRCSGVELHKRVTGFVGQNFHKSVEIPPRRRPVIFVWSQNSSTSGMVENEIRVGAESSTE
jgi:hypothetical protein